MTNQTNESNRGGRREGAGRPATDTKSVTIRLTPLEHSILMSLGGSKYLREVVLGRLAEMTEDLAKELLEESEGDFRSAIDSMCGESVEWVCKKLPDDLSDAERQAVIENASLLLERERDKVGGNRYEVKDCESSENKVLDCYENFEFVAWSDEEAYQIVEARQEEADAKAVAIVEEAEAAGAENAYELRKAYDEAPSYFYNLKRCAYYKGEWLGDFDVPVC